MKAHGIDPIRSARVKKGLIWNRVKLSYSNITKSTLKSPIFELETVFSIEKDL